MSPRWLLWLAIAGAWFFWGATPTGMRFALATIPPFVMATLRFGAAGLAIWAVAAAVGRGRITAAALRDAAIAGVLLLLLGNGLMTWAIQFMPTGITAVLVSLSPVWMALMDFAYTRIPPRPLALAGMVLGIGGMAVLVGHSASGALPLAPLLAAFGSSFFWAAGSVYQRHARSDNPLLVTGLQMVAGAIFFAIEAGLLGEWRAWTPAAVSGSSWLGLAWLAVFGSLVGYGSFVYTMRRAPLGLATSYAFVNPMVAVVLGMLIFHERFTLQTGVAGALLLAGVTLMVLPVGLRLGSGDRPFAPPVKSSPAK